MKKTTEYIINFYYQKGSKKLEETIDYDNKIKAISALKHYKKIHDESYDIKLFKAITTYEEVKIEK